MTTDYAIFCAILLVIIAALSAIRRVRDASRARDEAERALSAERALEHERSRRSVIETLGGMDAEQDADLLETLQHH